MPLPKERRNAIFHAVAAGKLDPAECDLTFKTNGFTITHGQTNSQFEAQERIVDSGHSCALTVGSDPVSASTSNSFPTTMKKVQSWAEKVVKWRDTPDLWELKHGWQSLTDLQYENSLNTPFTSEEQAAISGQLAAIKESIKKTYELTAEQESKIDARFDEAEKASKRLGRKDWVLLFGGAVFSLILADAITPDIAQHILMMTVHGLEHLFTSGPRSLRAQ